MTEPAIARIAGMKKHHCHAEYENFWRIKVPHSMDTRPAPIEWELFQMDCLVASSDGLIQCAMRLPHGG